MAYATRGALLKSSNIIKCSLCMETFKEPKVLPCTHTFCLSCLETYCHDKSQHKMSCPLCRKVFIVPPGGVTNLPTVTTGASASTGQTPVEIESGLTACSFLDNPRVLNVMSAEYGSISGLAALGSQLFIVQDRSNTTQVTQVNVYDTNNWALIRKIAITDSCRLHALGASPQYNCLYISDVERNSVFRYNLSDDVITSWPVGKGCYGLSLTKTHNVLITLYDTNKIKEYTWDGSLVREISLDSSIKSAWHSVLLSSGQFIVCHGTGGSALHRVCIVDTSGHIIQCYGGSKGSEVGQLHVPASFAIDGHGNVLVADWANDRFVLLSPSLTHLGYLTTPKHKLSKSWALHLDPLTRRLYIGDYINTGLVFILAV